MIQRIVLSLAAFAFLALAPVSPSCGIGTSPSYAGEDLEDQIAADDDRPQTGVIVNSGVIVQSPLNVEQDPGGFVQSMAAAAKSGQWRLLAGGLLVLVVFLARRFGAKWVPWFATDRGGAALVLGTALLGGAGAWASGNEALGFGALVNALSMAFVAAGGYNVVKKLLAPSDK